MLLNVKCILAGRHEGYIFVHRLKGKTYKEPLSFFGLVALGGAIVFLVIADES